MALRNAGEIVLFPFPQTDMQAGKRRPAVLIAELPSKHGDWLICMMSSQTHQSILGIDDLIHTSDPDFIKTGLKSNTVIRLTRLAVVSDSILVGKLGEIGNARLQNLKSNLANWILNS